MTTELDKQDPQVVGEPDPRTERARLAIQHAARDLLHDCGPDAVTHLAVAHAANVSRTTVYKHHPTRGDLIRAAIEMVDPFPDELSGDLRTDLTELLGHLVEHLGDDDRARMMATYMERSFSDPELRDLSHATVRKGQEVFAQLVDEATAAGTLRPGIDPDLALAGLVGSLLYRCFLAKQPVDSGYAARVVDHFLAQHTPH